MRKPVLLTIILLLLALGVTAVLMRSGRSQNRAALVAYKAALRAKGEKITAEELGYPRPQETSSNLNLLVASVDSRPPANVKPGLLELMHLIAPGQAEVVWNSETVPVNSYRKNSKSNSATWETFSAQFHEASDALNDLRAATENPPRSFYFDLTNFVSRPSPPYVKIRLGAQWLSGDAMVALHERNLDRARADLHALINLVQFHREDLLLLPQMIRIAITRLGLVATWEALQSLQWTEAELAALQADWEAADVSNAFELGIVGERAFGTAAFAHARNTSAANRAQTFSLRRTSGSGFSIEAVFDRWIATPLWLANSEADELLYLQHLQASLDAFRQLHNGTPMVAVNHQLKTNIANLESILAKPTSRFRYMVTAITLPNYARAAATCIRAETQRRMTLVAIALERHRILHGKYPAELNALVPDLLAPLPIDPMSAKPFGYRTNSGGSFTLYSVGEDGVDNGGDPNPSAVTNRFDFWEGKDAVWPAPAK